MAFSSWWLRISSTPWAARARLAARGALWIVALAAIAWVGSRATVGLANPALAGPGRSAPNTLVTSSAVPSASSDRVGPTGAMPPCGAPDRVTGAVLPDGRVVLNLAGAGDLMQLPGIGEKRARAIVHLREKLGRFRSLRDLLRIKGIGPRMLRRLEPKATLDSDAPSPGSKDSSSAAKPSKGA